MSDKEEGVLNSMLSDIEQNTSDEITIVTTNDLQDESIEMYAVLLFKEWGIGKAGVDNGILILQVPSMNKYRIEVGYVLEGDLNDAKVGDITRECIETNFSKQKYFDGYKCTIEKIRENLTPVKKNPENDDSSKEFLTTTYSIGMIRRLSTEEWKTIIVIVLAGIIGLTWIAWSGKK